MNVNIEELSALERKVTVKIPSDDLQQKIDAKIKELAPKIRMDGFRQGKVPIAVVRKRFGEAIRGEIISDILRETFPEVLKEKKLNLAGMPEMKVTQSAEGQPLEYTATFEIVPSVSVNPINELEVEKVTAEVAESDVAKTLENVQKQHIEWIEVDRAAKNGDQIIIDFIGTMAGEAFAGNTAKDFALELGSKLMIPGFEDELVGANAGDQRIIKIKFPEDYHNAEVAGKNVEFDVKINKVKEAKIPPIDDELAKKIGVEGGLEGLKAEIRKTLERELAQSIRFKNREHVFAVLLKHNSVELPKSMVNAEYERVLEQTKQMMKARTGKDEPLMEHNEEFKRLAERRVALSLLLGELVKAQNIEVDKDLVRKMVDDAAASYHQPQQVVDWYYRNKEQLAQIESAAMEQQIVDKIYEQAKVTEKSLSYTEAMQREETKDDE